MNKQELAYKLTADVLKKYDLQTLETRYEATGGKLVSAVFNDVYSGLRFDDPNESVPLIIDDMRPVD